MNDFQINPPILVKDTPKPRRLKSLQEARAFVEESMHIGRPEPWRDIQHRLRNVASAEDADETVGALRELLELEDLLFAPNTPPAA